MIEKKDNTVKFNMLSDIQKRALSLMQKGKNVFLSGAAGSGKTTLMRIFIDNYPGNCVVVAPTGVAAVNIGGQTIHSFFALPFSLMTPTTLDYLKWPSVREKINKTNCIIIDEISMVRSDVFWAIDRRCKESLFAVISFNFLQLQQMSQKRIIQLRTLMVNLHSAQIFGEKLALSMLCQIHHLDKRMTKNFLACLRRYAMEK